MKIICDCGNQSEFNTIDEDTGKEGEWTSEGQYATLTPDTYSFWEMHDQVGIVCEVCDRAIWMFT